MRQKYYWEKKVRELGGGNYQTSRKQLSDIGNFNLSFSSFLAFLNQSKQIILFFPWIIILDGKEIPGAPNYKYYGAAKNLPGVREIFAEIEETAEKKRLQRSRGEIKRNVTPSYYGFQNELNDETLLLKEKQREVKESFKPLLFFFFWFIFYYFSSL